MVDQQQTPKEKTPKEVRITEITPNENERVEHLKFIMVTEELKLTNPAKKPLQIMLQLRVADKKWQSKYWLTFEAGDDTKSFQVDDIMQAEIGMLFNPEELNLRFEKTQLSVIMKDPETKEKSKAASHTIKLQKYLIPSTDAEVIKFKEPSTVKSLRMRCHLGSINSETQDFIDKFVKDQGITAGEGRPKSKRESVKPVTAINDTMSKQEQAQVL